MKPEEVRQVGNTRDGRKWENDQNQPERRQKHHR
jgi:hypothetical protein